MVVVIYIINQINYKFSSFISDYEIDAMKARALTAIKFLVETGDIEKHYIMPIPVDVVMVNDVTGSMSQGCNCVDVNTCTGCVGACKICDAKAAAKFFVDLLNSSLDRSGLVSFSTSATLRQGLTFDKIAVKNAIDSLTTGGATAIGSGINAANNELTSNGRVGSFWFEILLSDGGENQNSNPIGRANEAKTKNITIYTIGLPGTDFNEILLKDIAYATDGKYYFAPTSNDLTSIYQQIAYEIKTERIMVGLISKQPYNISEEKIDGLKQNCDRLNAFDFKTYRLKIYNSTDLLLLCGTETLKPPIVSVSKNILIENNLGNITLDLW